MRSRNIINDLKSFYRRYSELSIIIGIVLVSLLLLKQSIFILFYFVYFTYFAGKLIHDFLNSRKLVTLFIYGGFSGGLVFLSFFWKEGQLDKLTFFSSIIMAGVYALVGAVITYKFKLELQFFMLVKLKLGYLLGALVIMDVFSVFSAGTLSQTSRFGGLIFGVLYILILKSNFNLISLFKKRFKTPRMRKVKSEGFQRPLTDEEYNRQKVQNQLEIDRILDKISKSGYESLSKKEKDTLFNISNKN